MLSTLAKVARLSLMLAVLVRPFNANAEQLSRPKPLLKSRVDPKEFGIQDDTRTVISAMGFKGCAYLSPSFGRGCGNSDGVVNEYYATLDIPAGAVIDAIGLNSSSDTDGLFGVTLWQRDRHANMTLLATFSAPAHSWDTDYAAGLNIQVPDRIDKEFVLNVEEGIAPQIFEYFAWVEVWWHRTVSPPPSIARFLDVPTSHPFFQFIEAIAAAGITVGCGGGNFCPDQPITRKQEAAFLAKALGLHWPN